jgi:tetraacyldisaccharide 4'-kinase
VGYKTGLLKTRRLSHPVISVGNLTVGGTGKTPLVSSVAKALLRQGLKPSILTRGYGRRSQAQLMIIEPGEGHRADPQEVGDEPALLARMLPEVPIVLCADRFRGGQAAEARFHVDAHILDDGFQHLALARDIDLVALDATQRISNWRLLPAGRQREPLSALGRAQIVIITRVDSGDAQSLQNLVQKVQPAARIFRSRTALHEWTDAWSGQAIPHAKIRGQKVAAFCGVGNPQAFFADLRRWGFTLVAEDAFPDHHVYTGGEIHQLVETARKNGASALLTTQKDAVKFSRDWTPGLPILACEIEAQILEAEDFERSLLTMMEKAQR